MPSCAIKGCKNHLSKVKKKDGISYHRFPSNPVRNEQWCRIVRLQRRDPYFKPHKDTRICSVHFLENDCEVSKSGLRKLKKTAIPAINGCENIEDQTATPYVDDNSTLDEMNSPTNSYLKKEVKRLQYKKAKLKREVKKLRQHYARLQKKNQSIPEIINELARKHYITADIETVLEKNAEVAELYRLQMLKNKNENKRMSFPPVLRKFAMTLNFCSPSAYKYVRRKFDCCLPHPSTLSKWYSTFNAEPGFTKEAFDMLKLKRQNMSENISCGLIFDEMDINQAKVCKGKKNTGHVDLGTGNVDKEKKATKVFVMMLVSLSENWKIPAGYFLVDNFGSDLIANSVNMCLEKCYSVGVDVEAVTFDGCPTNVKAANILGCNLLNVEELKTTFPHPVTKESVAVFLDACHMVKLVRNAFEKKKTIYNMQGNAIQWKFLTDLLKLQNNQRISFANKLTYRHILFKNRIKKAKLGIELLSRSVANSLTLCEEMLKPNNFSDSQATAEFINTLNDVYDVLNSRRFNQTGYKRALSLTNKDEVVSVIDKAIEYIKGLEVKIKVKRQIIRRNRQPRIVNKIIRKRILETKSNTGFLGLIVCLESLKIVFHKLVEQKSILECIPTYRLSQDHLEQFFGLIRRHLGNNDNLNCNQFKEGYRRSLNNFSLRSTFTGNSVPLEIFPILPISSAEVINSTLNMNRHEEEDREFMSQKVGTETYDDMFSRNCAELVETLHKPTESIFGRLTENVKLAVGYIAGLVARNLMKKIKCEICIDSLISNEKLSFHKLIELENMGGLCFPSIDVFEICLETEKSIRQIQRPQLLRKTDCMYLTTKTLSKFVGKATFSSLEQHATDQPAILNHRVHLIRAIVKHYISVRMHHECARENTEKATVRQTYFFT